MLHAETILVITIPVTIHEYSVIFKVILNGNSTIKS